MAAGILKPHNRVLAVAFVVLAAALVACGDDNAGVPALKDCPAAVGAPHGAPGGGPGSIPVSTTIAPSDTSTSTIIKKSDSPQIQCGRTPVDARNDVVFSTPALAGGKPLELKMDVQVPKTTGTKPVIVYLPGGGFQVSPKEIGLNVRTYLAEQGFVVASIQYRTVANGGVYSDGVTDVKSAIRYLRAYAAQYGINPASVGLWGESAGGYLAAMAGTTNGLKQFDAGGDLGQSGDVQAVVDKFGPSDLTKIAADFDPAVQRSYASASNAIAQYVNGTAGGKSLADDPAAAAKANPLSYVDGSDPAFVLLHGSVDNIVSPSQTLLLHNALRKAGVDSTRYVVEGAGHGDIAVTTDSSVIRAWTTQEVMGHVVDFLNRHLKH